MLCSASCLSNSSDDNHHHEDDNSITDIEDPYDDGYDEYRR